MYKKEGDLCCATSYGGGYPEEICIIRESARRRGM